MTLSISHRTVSRSALLATCLLLGATAGCAGPTDDDGTVTTCGEGTHREGNRCVADESNASDQRQRPDIDGTYTCTFSATDPDVRCAGPVLETDLSGSAQTMNVTETESRVEIGIWGVILEGGLRDGGGLDADYEDKECPDCSVEDPYQIELTGQADGDGIRNIDVRVWQTGHGATDCEKTYEGSCARD